MPSFLLWLAPLGQKFKNYRLHERRLKCVRSFSARLGGRVYVLFPNSINLSSIVYRSSRGFSEPLTGMSFF